MDDQTIPPPPAGFTPVVPPPPAGFAPVDQNAETSPGKAAGPAFSAQPAQASLPLAYGGIAQQIETAIREGPIGRAVEKFFPSGSPVRAVTGTPTTTVETEREDPLLKSAILPLEAGMKPGAARGVASFAGGMTTPENLSILAATGGVGALEGSLGKSLVSRLISAGFSGQMLWNAAQRVPGLMTAIGTGDWARAREIGTQGALETALAAMGVRHAVGGGETAAAETPPAESVPETQAKETVPVAAVKATPPPPPAGFTPLAPEGFSPVVQAEVAPAENAATIGTEAASGGSAAAAPVGTATGVSEAGVDAGAARPVDAGAVGEGRAVHGENAPGPRRFIGKTTSVLIPGDDRAIPAHYEARELDDLNASHIGATFAPNPRYQLKNERDYSKPENQQRVLEQSSEERFEPRYHITNNPDMTNGPPLMFDEGQGAHAIAGNDRLMQTQRVYARNGQKAQAYRDLFAEDASHYGIDPEAVRGMEKPVLVRVADEGAFDALPGTTQWAVRKTNVTGTAALSASERAAADAGQLAPEMVEHIANAIEAAGPDATLNDALTGKSGTAIVNRLIGDGFFSEQERPALMDGKTGALTQVAKDRISKALLGQFFRDSDQISRTPAAVKQKLERIAAPLAKVHGDRLWDLTPAFREAVDLLEYAGAHGIKNLGDVVAQQGMFPGETEQWHGDAVKLAEWLRDSKPNDLVSATRRYVNDRAPTMFGEATPEEAFRQHFGGEKEERPAPAAPALQSGAMDADAAEQRALENVHNNLAGLARTYREKFGNEISTDNAREIVSPEYAASAEARTQLSGATQKPAGLLSDFLFDQALEHPDATRPRAVVMTAGGTGAGKTTAVRGMPDLADAQFVYDSNLGSKKSSVQKIEAAKAAGNRVDLIFVHRDPVEALTGGVLPRAMEEGRVVSLDAHARMYRDSAENFAYLTRKYGKDAAVRFWAFDNAGGEGAAKPMPIEEAAKIRYSTKELLPKLRAALESEYAQGRISEPVYRATLGSSSPEAPGGVPRDPGSGGAPTGGAGATAGDALRNPAGRNAGEPEPGRSGERSAPEGPQTQQSGVSTPAENSQSHNPESGIPVLGEKLETPEPGPVRQFLSDEKGTSLVGDVFGRDAAEMRGLKEKREAALEALRKAKATPEQMKVGQETMRSFLAERDVWATRVNQVIGRLRKIVPDKVEQEGLALMRDFKGREEELTQFLQGTHPAFQELDQESPLFRGISGSDLATAQKRIEQMRPAILKALDPSERMLKADATLTKIAQATLEEGKRLGMMDSRWTAEEYNPHILHAKGEGEYAQPGWVARQAGRALGGKMGKYFAFAERREFPTLLHAVVNNYVPKTLNALDAFTIHGDKFATARATRLLEGQLTQTGMGTYTTLQGKPKGSVALAEHATEFRRTLPTTNPETGQPDVAEQRLYVPKYIDDALRPITDPDYMGKIPLFAKVRAFQAYQKAIQLGLSMFHAYTENLMAASNMGPSGWFKALRADRNGAEFWKAERDFIAHQGTTDIQGKTVEAYKSLQPGLIPTWRDIAVSNSVGRGVDAAARTITDFTFGNLQRRFKVMDYVLHKAAWEAQHPQATAAERDTALTSMAKEINAVYGGLKTETMGINRATVEIARAGLLAPDWTFSNVANVKYAFQRRTPAGKMARAFWIRQAVGGAIATQLLSLMFSRKLSKNPTQVYFGKDDQGRDIYQNVMFKGALGDAINIIHDMQDYGAVEGLVRFAAAKAAGVPRAAFQFITNRDYLGHPIVAKGLNPVASTVRGSYKMVEALAPVPFTVTNLWNMLAGPDAAEYKPPEWLTTFVAGNPPRHVAPEGMRMTKQGLRPKHEKPQQSTWQEITTDKR